MLAILVLIGLAGSLEGSTVDSSPYALGYRGHRVQRSPQVYKCVGLKYYFMNLLNLEKTKLGELGLGVYNATLSWI